MDRPSAAFHGYSRVELDDFLTSVAEERSRLEAAIADDEERTRAARAALGTHRVMVSMLLQAQRKIDEIRAGAETEAWTILSSSPAPAPVLDITRLEQSAPSFVLTASQTPTPSAPRFDAATWAALRTRRQRRVLRLPPRRARRRRAPRSPTGVGMTAMQSRLTPPRPVELVPEDEAVSIIDGAHRELADLEERAAQARTVADETRARVEHEGADERASAWAIVRLQRFLDDLREEAEHDARLVVAAARRNASTELDPTIDESQAPPIPRVPSPPIAVAPEPAASPAPEAHAPDAPDAVAPGAPLVAVAPLPIEVAPAAADDAPVAPAPEPKPELIPIPVPVVSWVPPAKDLPATTNGGGAPPAQPLAAFAPVTAAAPVIAAVPATAVAPAPVAPAPVAPAPVATVAPPAPAVAAEPAKHRGRLHGFPLSAALDVLAVLLVLAFILLRLS